MIEKKNALDQTNDRLDSTEENISKPEDITIKTIQSATEKGLKKGTEDEWSLNCRTTLSSQIYLILECLQGKKRKAERKNTGKIMAK